MRRLALAAAVFISGLDAHADRAAAEGHYKEGLGRWNANDMIGAIDAYTRAIVADPEWANPYGMRGYARFHAIQYDGALLDFGRAMELAPGEISWRLGRVQAYLALDRVTEALEDGEALVELAPDKPSSHLMLGNALVAGGEVDAGFERMTKALEMSGNDPEMMMRAEAFRATANWAGLAEEAERARAGGRTDPPTNFNRVVGYTELGEYAKARAAIADIRTVGTTVLISQAYLAATPQAGEHHNPVKAVADAKLAAQGFSDSIILCVLARALFLDGRTEECLDLVSTKGKRTHFETMFWMGASYWKLGRFAEARVILKDARRLNPYLARHADRVAGFRDFVIAVDREMAAEGGDRGRLGFELATHLLTVAEIEALVRRYRFERAAEEYERLLTSLKSSVRRGEVETRLPEVKGMAGAHAKLVAAVGRPNAKLKAKLGKTELTLEKADAVAFHFTIPGGDGKFPWAYLDPAIYGELAGALDLKPEERFGLGCLLWDAGLHPQAMKLFDEALKKQAALRKNLASFVARKRGIAAPEGGFVAFRGAYVTPEEKASLEKGLVLFEGKWVTAKDREQLARGNVQIDGKWVPGEEAALLARGFRRYQDRWMSREDYDAVRGTWEHAFVESTAHYEIRTNEGEQFAKDLALLAEAAYAACRAFYGGAEPKLAGSDRMTLFAFRTYEDYRKYCVETKTEDHLSAAGFARSDSNTVAGWNKTSNRQQFLQTMVHEAAHLYYYRIAPAARAPSWHAESMATYFEGFAWDGRTYRFTFVSESRLSFARDAMKGGRHIPLKDLLAGDGLKLIQSDAQKALLFYAQCWALNYYLCQTENRTYRDAYAEYRKHVAGGGSKTLLEFFPDAAKLEADWVRFVLGL